ncbi:promotilin [Lonchura striata]
MALGMVSRKVVASLLLVSLLSVLAEQTQGFMPFFTQSDFQKMQLQEKERNKAGQKKSLSSLQQLEEEGFSEQSGVDVNAAKTLQQALPVRAWLTPRQLEKYQDVLEKLLAELLQDTPDGTVRGLISALGILPFLLLTSSSAQRYLYSPEGFLCHVCSLVEPSDPNRSRVHPSGKVIPLSGSEAKALELLKLKDSTYVNEICQRD